MSPRRTDGLSHIHDWMYKLIINNRIKILFHIVIYPLSYNFFYFVSEKEDFIFNYIGMWDFTFSRCEYEDGCWLAVVR